MRCRNVSKIVSFSRCGIHPQFYLPREVRAEEATPMFQVGALASH